MKRALLNIARVGWVLLLICLRCSGQVYHCGSNYPPIACAALIKCIDDDKWCMIADAITSQAPDPEQPAVTALIDYNWKGSGPMCLMYGPGWAMLPWSCDGSESVLTAYEDFLRSLEHPIYICYTCYLLGRPETTSAGLLQAQQDAYERTIQRPKCPERSFAVWGEGGWDCVRKKP